MYMHMCVRIYVYVVARIGFVKAHHVWVELVLVYCLSVTGFSFYTFESLKHWSLSNFGHGFMGRPCPKNDGELVLSLTGRLICGGVAGCVAQTIS